MNASLSSTLLLIALAPGSSAQDPQHFESRHFSFECSEVAHIALEYLPKHGLSTSSIESDSELRVFRAGRVPWTDANGNAINDFRAYWTYADKKSGDKLPLGMWRLRLGHYEPHGKMSFSVEEAGCKVEFALVFFADGAIVRGVFPADDDWEYLSNGRLEREYLDGFAANLTQRKPTAAEQRRSVP